MTHLPECKALDAMPESYKMFMRTSQKWFWEHSCICDALRACEQRVSAKKDEIIGLTAFHSYEKGYNDALEEAEEAILAVLGRKNHNSKVIYANNAVRAIRALREEQP